MTVRARDVMFGVQNWSSLAWFRSRMEAKLLANRHKGGWSKMSDEELVSRLTDELDELRQAIAEGDDQSVINEAADVANFAYFIADNRR